MGRGNQGRRDRTQYKRLNRIIEHFLHSFYTMLEVLSRAIKQEEEIKGVKRIQEGWG